MRWLKRFAAVLLMLVGVGVADAQSARKVALVIGNGAYTNATRLPNPTADARLIEGALRRAGFTSTETRTDVNLAAFQLALRDFAARARGADVALVYFAGHGLEANGQNWLVPTDAKLAADSDLEFESVRLESVLRAVEGARIRIVILDACRDNPFARTMRRFSPMRAVSRGLVGVEADDVLIMYAAAQGQTAADGVGANSPFATALSRRLPEPGVELRLLAGKVRDDVLAATNGAQRPFIAASITGEALYLVRPSGVPTPANAPSATSPATVTDRTRFVARDGFVKASTVLGEARGKFVCVRPQGTTCETISVIQTVNTSSARWMMRTQYRSGSLIVISGYSSFDSEGFACQDEGSLRVTVTNPRLTTAQTREAERMLTESISSEIGNCSGYQKRGATIQELTFDPRGRQRGNAVDVQILAQEPTLRLR